MSNIIIPEFAIKDRASTWTDTFAPAPSFDIGAYQEKINRLAGFTSQGEPVLRLVWGGNLRVRKAVEHINGIPVRWEDRPRYQTKRGKAIRRWMILQNTDINQLGAMGGRNETHLQVKEKGFYSLLILIASHSKCPPDCPAENLGCLGDYKAPCNAELDWIKEATQWLEANRTADPRKSVTPNAIAKKLAEETPRELTEKEKEEKNTEDAVNFVQRWIKDNKHPVSVDLGHLNL